MLKEHSVRATDCCHRLLLTLVAREFLILRARAILLDLLGATTVLQEARLLPYIMDLVHPAPPDKQIIIQAERTIQIPLLAMLLAISIVQQDRTVRRQAPPRLTAPLHLPNPPLLSQIPTITRFLRQAPMGFLCLTRLPNSQRYHSLLIVLTVLPEVDKHPRRRLFPKVVQAEVIRLIIKGDHQEVLTAVHHLRVLTVAMVPVLVVILDGRISIE